MPVTNSPSQHKFTLRIGRCKMWESAQLDTQAEHMLRESQKFVGFSNGKFS